MSQPASTGHLETETADDFILTETTSIAEATITGLIPLGTTLANINNVEVEVYHVSPMDSADPPSGNVPARANSPADVEIDTATRDASLGTLALSASLVDESFSVLNTVVDGIDQAPTTVTDGEGPASGDVAAARRAVLLTLGGPPGLQNRVVVRKSDGRFDSFSSRPRVASVFVIFLFFVAQ